MEEFTEAVTRIYIGRAVSASTVRFNRSVLRDLIEGVGVRTVGDLDGKAVDRFARLRPDLHINTRILRLETLHAILGRAKEAGLIESIPPFPETPEKELSRQDPARDDEIIKLMDYLRARIGPWEEHRFFVLVGSAAFAGLTLEEAKHLLVTDVYLDESRIHVERRESLKYDRHRVLRAPDVYIGGDFKEMLRRWLPRTIPPFVFPSTKVLGPWAVGRLGRSRSYPLAEASQGAGLTRKMTFPLLRRYYESRPRVVFPDALSAPPICSRPSVEIGEPDEPFSVLGEPKWVPSEVAYLGMKILLAEFPQRLSLKELEEKSGGRKVREALETIKFKDQAVCNLAIEFPGKGLHEGGRGYGILSWSELTERLSNRYVYK